MQDEVETRVALLFAEVKQFLKVYVHSPTSYFRNSLTIV